jgi:2-keto-4-pentenoate hydratase/2-oxohepta-3-ene-1,7-dioic acid hydratase in catechol pathway
LPAGRVGRGVCANCMETDKVRLITFRHQGQEEIGALVDRDSRVIRLQRAEQLRRGEPDPQFGSMLGFLQGGLEARDTAQAAVDFAESQRPDGVLLERSKVELLSPVPRPESIREFMVFEQHVINCLRKFQMPHWLGALDEWVDGKLGRKATQAYRLNRPWYERPIYYKGNRMSVVGDGARVAMPSYTKTFDWELEFGIFLCKTGRDIPREKARDYIGGYTVFNDFSARDIQGREMAARLGPAKGKDFDGGNALGPALVTPDEIPDPYNLAMTARINGQEVSRGHTKGMYWTFEQMIAYVSQSETLYPGEFFGSGTGTIPESGKDRRCCGLEMGRFLKAGEKIELEVERIGTLTNYIVGRG